MFKAVIFDWDGTLADSNNIGTKIMQKVLSEAGYTVDDRALKSRIGVGTKQIFREVLEEIDATYDEILIQKLYDKNLSDYTKALNKIQLFNGVVELLDTLHNQVIVALATMSERKAIDLLLQEKKLSKYFDIVVAADEASKPKPDPEIFLKCASKVDVEPDDCVVVEDSVFGVKAAKEAGMKCIAVTTGFYTAAELEREGADLITSSVNDKDKITRFIF